MIEPGQRTMPVFITVSDLKYACLDPQWRSRWLEGKRPSTKPDFPIGEPPAFGTLFHHIADAFVGWLTTTRSRTAPALIEGDALWQEMHDRFAVKKLTRLFKKGYVDSGYHLVLALKAFCRRAAELRARRPDFQTWRDVYLAKEFTLKNVRFDLGTTPLFVSGQLDAVRFHPQYGLEVVDYKLTHGRQMKHDLVQLAIYARLLTIAKPGIDFHGTLEYFEPQLHEVPVSPQDLEHLFDDAVLPVLYQLAGEQPPMTPAPGDPVEIQGVRIPELTHVAERPAAVCDVHAARAIEECYASFNLEVEVIDQHEAPQLIRYEVRPAPGVKVSSLAKRADDLRVWLSLSQTPIIEPTKGAVVIDINKENADTVYWRDVVTEPAIAQQSSPLAFPVGVGVDNRLLVADLADANMCHALVAGSSGSGKSEFLKCLVASLVSRNSPTILRLTLIDPKILTFGGLSSLPHLTEPVITDIRSAIPCLQAAADEMDRRYRKLAEEGVESLSDRFRSGRSDIGYRVVMFDEFADLILAGKNQKKTFEHLVAKLAAKGRAAGIHLVLATQRPDRTVLTGLIKSNLPLKICMRVISATNSSIVLDQAGAEKLLGRGDILCDRGRGVERAQSPYISQDELKRLAASRK
jgi:S-DNA-T family DNA segregation ATPase FtsK/SpoIIIE